MKYGHFDDVNREYVITTPKTPLLQRRKASSPDTLQI